MGTPLREIIDSVGGGARHGHQIVAILPGVANGLVPADQLATPVTYEAMQEIGSGVGSAGFMVFDEDDDLAAVAAGVSRFLAVESCGQCTPCKQDGLKLADLLAKVCRGEAGDHDLDEITKRASTVGDRARCYLALQHQAVVSSVVERFGEQLSERNGPVEPALIAELVDVSNGQAAMDERFRDKQPDWTYDETSSGKAPADRFGEHRAGESLHS
jgi:NADH:ubiquinone oxidoreductase subunit F (NADH-binding)